MTALHISDLHFNDEDMSTIRLRDELPQFLSRADKHGNHDIDRTVEGRDEAIERVMFNHTGYYDPAKGIIEEADLRAIHAGQADFRDFLSKLFIEDEESLRLSIK